MPKLFALLVGIDQYPDPRHRLNGCVNDASAMADCLRGRTDSSQFELRSLLLTNAEASRDRVIAGIREHLCQAGPDDVALFYFAGHGSQQASPPEFWPVEPDRLDETLVCHDSRTASWDLADKELATLVAELAAKRAHIAIILDCCHSGSGTRAPLPDAAVRRMEIDPRPRPLSSFLLSPQLTRGESIRSLDQAPAGWSLAGGRHILMAACRDSEEAKEHSAGGKTWGAFSYFLRATLESADRRVTYRDLVTRTQALVRGHVSAQTPQLEATHSADVDQPFLGGAILDRTPSFPVRFDRELGWVMAAGAVHGIAGPSGDECTSVALFPFDAQGDALRSLAASVAQADVVTVHPVQSVLRIQPGKRLHTAHTFKAVVIGVPLPPLSVRLDGEAAGIELARQAIASAGSPGPSVYVRESTDAAAFGLVAQNGEFVILRRGDEATLGAPITGYTPSNAAQAVARLERIARWTKTADLRNPASAIPAGALQVIVLRDGAPAGDAEVNLPYTLSEGKWQPPTFTLKVVNASDKRLYCAVLALSESFAIHAGLFSGGGVWIDPGHDAWASSGRPIPATVPDDLWASGVTERRDLLKIIASDAEFDATLLEQRSLDAPAQRGAQVRRALTSQSTLNRLMNRVQAREVASPLDADAVRDDWTTADVSIVTVRPRTTIQLSESSSVDLGVGVSIAAHSRLKAHARLSTVTQASLDLGNLLLPDMLRDGHSLQFSAPRGHDPGLSVIELSNVNDVGHVTPDDPLRIILSRALDPGEHVLPVAFDGELFVPLGFAMAQDARTTIVLERLAACTRKGRRDVAGIIRILFRKVIAAGLRASSTEPRLTAFTHGENSGAHQEGGGDPVRSLVAAAAKVIVCVPGILGSASGMAAAAQACCPEALILTFDQAGDDPSIPDLAARLHQLLQAVGLTPDSRRRVSIVGHSTGGLTARWYLEQLGGHELVGQLVMIGTPNGGTPWSDLHALTTVLLEIAFNRLSTAIWPATVMKELAAAHGRTGGVLDEVQPGSELLRQLADSPDPRVPYTVVAGGSSIVAAAPVNRQPFSGPNDLLATVESMTAVPAGRTPAPKVSQVACDQMTYLGSAEVRTLLTAALNQP